MMTLSDLLASAQGGNGIEMLARQFNLSPQQAQEAVDALLPAFSRGLKANAADPYGFGSFLSALSSGQHAKYFEDATSAFTQQGVSEGNGILKHLFGSKDVSRAIAEQASQVTGIGQQVVKQMLPAIATMLMGGMFKQTNNQMAAGGFSATDNPLGDLIDQMMRQSGAKQAPAPQQQSEENPFGRMLEDLFGGGNQSRSPAENPRGKNPLEDILGQILRGGQPQSPQPNQQTQTPGGNPWGDVLDQILRGGQAEPAREDQERRRPPSRSGNPLEEIFGKMLEPGKQMGETYQQGIDSIFEQYRRGMDRFR
ncbi:MAG: DUF937 domain-containing protein [Rhizobiaceae bacterium]|nr:DUF937 domain-containing protein [Rhizobiaceae bacterium]